MANTLKFGNENWATKKDSILAYNDENANFKPLPFVTSRASTATRVNKAGLLETVASGVPRVDYLDNSKGSYLLEPASTNLITKSEAFGNSYWTKSGATIQGDASTAGNEKVTGTDADFSGAGNWISTAATLTTAYNSGDAGHSTTLRIESDNTASDRAKLSINWTKGVIYKITFDYKVISGTSANIDVANNLAVSSDNALQSTIWTTKTIYFTADVTGANLLQIYSSRSGSATDELLIDNVSVKEVQGFSAPSADSPLGAFKLVEDTSTSTHKNRAINALSSATNYTMSVVAKKGERNWLSLNDVSASTVYFDLENGVVGSTVIGTPTYGIESLSDGWYRCWMNATTSASGHFGIYLAESDGVSSYTGDGTSGVYIFGAQLEQQSYATSYIKTSGSQITRLSDTASQTVPDGIIGQTEGTVYAEVNLSSIESMGVYCGWKIDGTSGNQLAFIMYPNGRIQATVFYGGSLVVNINDNNYGLTSGKHKIAFAYKQNDYILYVDGSVVGSDTSAAVPIVNDFDISYTNGGSLKYNQTKLYNTRLSNSELAKLTTI